MEDDEDDDVKVCDVYVALNYIFKNSVPFVQNLFIKIFKILLILFY